MTLYAVSDLPDTTDTTWQEHGACRGADADLFFPERGASTREAKAVCRGCAVREECLEFAITSGEKFGIWGGLSERERRRIRRLRAGEPETPPSPPPPERLVVRRPRTTPFCGTRAGYKRHRRAGDGACDDCRTANAEYRETWVQRQREGAAL